MKKAIVLFLCIVSSYNLFSQAQMSLRAGVNFSKAKFTNPVNVIDWNTNEPIEFSRVAGPAFHFGLRTSGINWKYFYEFGYSQLGYERITNYDLRCKIHRIEFANQGVQYCFFDDWAKIRTVVQTGIGINLIVADIYSTDNFYEDIRLQNVFDMNWILGAGVDFGKHFSLNLNYAMGLIDIYSVEYEMKQREVAFSSIIYF